MEGSEQKYVCLYIIILFYLTNEMSEAGMQVSKMVYSFIYIHLTNITTPTMQHPLW